jgi:hypothetical protein
MSGGDPCELERRLHARPSSSIVCSRPSRRFRFGSDHAACEFLASAVPGMMVPAATGCLPLRWPRPLFRRGPMGLLVNHCKRAIPGCCPGRLPIPA